MSEYAPMKGPLPGKQYVPSNGTEGACFLEGWCAQCARDRAMRRQIEAEGWTPEHDDAHSSGDLMQAAVCYAMGATFISGAKFDLWPWDRAWWKPKDKRSNLVRAAALLVAEIERLDRAAG